MRDITKIGAHVKGHNSESIGIAYEGGLNASGKATDTRTTAQKQSLETLLRFLLLTYPGAKVCGHRDLSPDLNHNGIIEPCEYIKECPCFNVRTEYGYLMENGKWRMDESVANYSLLIIHYPFTLPLPGTIKKEVNMKPFWRNTLRVLKVIGKIFVWLTGADSPVNDNEKKD